MGDRPAYQRPVRSPREGTVIRGTARPEHIIPALLVELRSYKPIIAEGISAMIPHDDLVLDDGVSLVEDHPWWETEEAIECQLALYDALNDIAEEGYFFGSCPGDGSDLGYWPDV
jgi:hypothetical protein